MAITVSSSPNSGSLYDPIRREWVVDQPEERVRQAVLREMIDLLGYPPQLIAVERALRQMPHLALSDQKIPSRRADIVVFAKGITGLFPILLIECKAVRITRRALLQVTGYNHYLGASFVCVVNEKEVRVGWFDEEWRFISRLPHYRELLCAASEGLSLSPDQV